MDTLKQASSIKCLFRFFSSFRRKKKRCSLSLWLVQLAYLTVD